MPGNRDNCSHGTVLPKLLWARESHEDLGNGDSDSRVLPWGPSVCILDKLPGDADTSGP